MSDVQDTKAAEAGGKWPAESGSGTVTPPLAAATLANAAARAALSGSRRDLMAYLQLRRKAKA